MNRPLDLGALVARSWDEHHLLSVSLELTYRCNLDCFFCYNDLELEGTPLDLTAYRRLVDELAELQVLYLTLTGGEPLAHPRFWEIGAHARERGFLLRVKSNGHVLDARRSARLKAELDPWMVDVSLHGATADSHDRQTRVPGSFARLMENLGHLREAGLRVQLNATLTRWNEDEVAGMYAIADAAGYPLVFDPTVSPRDDGDSEPLSISASDEGVLNMLRVQSERVKSVAVPGPDQPAPPRSRQSCGTGSSTLLVDPFGNVYPCIQLRRRLGNLHETTVTEIWKGSAELDRVRAQARQVATDGNRGLCLGLAEMASGDACRPYPEWEQRRRLFDRFRSEAG